MTRPALAVWLYGTRLAELNEPRAGRLALTWTEPAYERWGSGSRVVSHLLPIAAPSQHPEPARVKVFLDGLLPEGRARTNYAMDAGLDAEDTFGMIRRYGRDTAGALVFEDRDATEPGGSGWYAPLTDEEVGQRLLDVDRHAPTDPAQRGVESISLAGMQPKIGLHRLDGTWHACRDGAPSTWILKLAHPEDSPAVDVIDTEALCTDLARMVGLGRTQAYVARFGEVRAIVVERYDRVVFGADRVSRLHQEDLAQALGIHTGDPERKFQRGRRMPSLALAAEVLRAGGSEPDELLRLVAFSHAVGNTDLHAKNISVIRRDDGSAVLAPAYDIAMHLHHPTRNPLSALDVNARTPMAEISAGDVVAEGVSWGLPPGRAQRLVGELLSQLDEALRRYDVAAHSGVRPEAIDVVAERIRSGMDQIVHPSAPGPRPRRTGPRRRR